MTTQTQTITERFAAPLAGTRVNREQGYIDGVLVCGTTSRNNRDYPADVLRRDFAKYEGRVVNCDHADESTVGRRIGWFTDVRPGTDGKPRGRLHLLKSHPMTPRVFEAAERNPSLFGMSHVAVCGTKRVNGRETVESINKVLSIDLVADPATTASLYESTMSRVREAAGVSPAAGSAVVTALTEKARGLVDMLEQGVCTPDEFEAWVKELIADFKRAAEVGKGVPDADPVPATGEAFARWVNGVGPAVDGKAFAESLRHGWTPGPRVDGRAYADWLRSGTTKTFAEYTAPAEQKKFLESIRGY